MNPPVGIMSWCELVNWSRVLVCHGSVVLHLKTEGWSPLVALFKTSILLTGTAGTATTTRVLQVAASEHMYVTFKGFGAGVYICWNLKYIFHFFHPEMNFPLNYFKKRRFLSLHLKKWPYYTVISTVTHFIVLETSCWLVTQLAPLWVPSHNSTLASCC